MNNLDNQTLEDIFDYLDDLRESGVVNMFMAPKMVEEDFGITLQEARKAFVAWTEQFGE